MGLTFGGDNGFGLGKQNVHMKTSGAPAPKSDIKIIKEKENSTTLESDFKSNMLLSFYDFPKIESSTILTAQSKQNLGFRRADKSSIPFENEI
jgi:hypothetical protein